MDEIDASELVAILAVLAVVAWDRFDAEVIDVVLGGNNEGGFKVKAAACLKIYQKQ